MDKNGFDVEKDTKEFLRKGDPSVQRTAKSGATFKDEDLISDNYLYQIKSTKYDKITIQLKDLDRLYNNCLMYINKEPILLLVFNRENSYSNKTLMFKVEKLIPNDKTQHSIIVKKEKLYKLYRYKLIPFKFPEEE